MHKDGLGRGGGGGLLENTLTHIVLTLVLGSYRAKVTFKIIGNRRSRRFLPTQKFFFYISRQIRLFVFIGDHLSSKNFPLITNPAGRLSHIFEILINQGIS